MKRTKKEVEQEIFDEIRRYIAESEKSDYKGYDGEINRKHQMNMLKLNKERNELLKEEKMAKIKIAEDNACKQQDID